MKLSAFALAVLPSLFACATRSEPEPDTPPVAPPAAPLVRRPNIVVLFADDAGYADFGFQSVTEDDIRALTPHIDSIATEGTRFTDFYMSGCVCSPSRAGLLTGRYQQRFGHEKNIPPGYMGGGMSLAETTMADHLRAAGYVTGLVGKWHLGYPDDYHPNERGFDEFYGCLQGSRSYYPIEDPSPHRVLLDNREPTPEGGYTTDRFGAAAVRFIEAHAAEPFFLFVSFTAPHGPLQAKDEDLALPAIASIEKERRRKYVGLVKALDDNVGEILDALERVGLARDTLVVFTNDNGGQTQTGALNTPLRGKKGQLWEGGVRVPAAMRWPGVIAPGTVTEQVAISLDLLPTFLELAGAGPAKGAALDGQSLAPQLFGGDDPTTRTLYWRSKGSSGPIALRHGSWKLVWTKRTSEPELFDLSEDLSEAKDVAAEHPDLVLELQNRLNEWEAQLIEPLWGVRSK